MLYVSPLRRAYSSSNAFELFAILILLFKLVMEQLVKLLENNDRDHISLEFKFIDNLAPLMPHLKRLSVKSLSLRGNRIKELPLDFKALKISKLDLQNNPLANIRQTV
jgi:hypothetical protein